MFTVEFVYGPEADIRMLPTKEKAVRTAVNFISSPFADGSRYSEIVVFNSRGRKIARWYRGAYSWEQER